MENEYFNVVQYFKDGGYEYVRRAVDAKSAVHAAYHYTHCVSAVAGFTSRVIVTDSGDCICFEWIYGKGITFPEGYQ